MLKSARNWLRPAFMGDVNHAFSIFIQVVLPITSFIATVCFGIIAFVQARVRREITYWLSRRHSLKGAKRALPVELRRLANSAAHPYLLVVAIRISGARDIRADDFGDGKPLILGLGARVIGVARVDSGDSPKPRTRMAGSSLEIFPTLLRSGQRLLFCVIVDGRKPAISCKLSPLADVRLRPAAPDLPGPIAERVPLLGFLSIIFELLFHPSGSILGWYLAGVWAAAAGTWIMVIIWVRKVYRKVREYRAVQRFLNFHTADTLSSSPVGADLSR